MVFVLRFERECHLIGTTDVSVDDAETGAPRPPEIEPEEITYLCDTVNSYFEITLTSADVVWTYSGPNKSTPHPPKSA